jgi:hypothetical protein
MTYSLRDADGTAKLAVSNYDAKNLMNKIHGHFKNMAFKNLGTKIVFVVEFDGSITYGDIRIFLKKNDYFFPEG